MFMSLPVKDRAIVNIKVKTTAKYSSIAQDLLVVYAISGADTLAALFYGKNKVVKVVKKVCPCHRLVTLPLILQQFWSRLQHSSVRVMPRPSLVANP